MWMIKVQESMYLTDKNSQNSSVVWPVWLISWVFLYEISSCVFQSHCIHLVFRYCTCGELGVSWNPGNYRLQIYSERTCDLMKTLSQCVPYRKVLATQLNDLDSLAKCVWVFIYRRSGCGFVSCFVDLNSRYCPCFEPGVSWHSVNYWVASP